MNTYAIKWAKTNPKAIIPSKRNGDAGFDIYGVIPHDFTIAPGTVRLVPTGIAYEITPGWHLIAKERGSTAKINLKVSAGCNDNSFRGEVQAFLYNGNRDKTIVLSLNEEKTVARLLVRYEEYLKEKYNENYRGFKKEKFLERYIIYPVSKAVCQLVPVYSPDGTSEEVLYETLTKTERGKGMLGDSGK